MQKVQDQSCRGYKALAMQRVQDTTMKRVQGATMKRVQGPNYAEAIRINEGRKGKKSRKRREKKKKQKKLSRN